MRCLHLPSSYLPETVGGTEVYVQQLCAGLRQLGHESVVAWHTNNPCLAEDCIALPPRTRVHRTDVYTRATGRPPTGFADLLDRVRPDVAHFHAFTLGASLDHARLLRELHIPYVITFHTPSMSCALGTWLIGERTPCDGLLVSTRCSSCVLGRRKWPRFAVRLGARSPLPVVFRNSPWTSRVALPALLDESFDAWREFFLGASRVVACADFVRERLVLNGIPMDRIEVLRQALPGATRTRRLRMPKQSGTRPLRLGFFGRLKRSKGPDLLLRAAQNLRAQGLDVQVALAGPIEQSERRWIEEVVSRHSDYARLVGTLRSAELRDWLDGIDIAVVPSCGFETGPLTLLEAWDAGVPVIGTDLGGIAEFMRPQGLSQFLFPLGDAEGLASAVHRMLDWRGADPIVTIPGMDELSGAMIAIYERSSLPVGTQSVDALTGGV